MEGSMRLPLFTTTAVCSLLIALGIGLATPASAAEIRVLNANALTIALRELAAEHTKQTGNQVTFISGSPGQIQQKVDAGGEIRSADYADAGSRRARYSGEASGW
jgi:ABC-type molybdate transport system substrate-binding protein